MTLKTICHLVSTDHELKTIFFFTQTIRFFNDSSLLKVTIKPCSHDDSIKKLLLENLRLIDDGCTRLAK